LIVKYYFILIPNNIALLSPVAFSVENSIVLAAVMSFNLYVLKSFSEGVIVNGEFFAAPSLGIKLT